jgi:hypothetical protein|tara:strand:- start:181 stop:300 length:120 start_codon:yes stop_codon:yes gene_type:complete
MSAGQPFQSLQKFATQPDDEGRIRFDATLADVYARLKKH